MMDTVVLAPVQVAIRQVAQLKKPSNALAIILKELLTHVQKLSRVTFLEATIADILTEPKLLIVTEHKKVKRMTNE